MPNFSQEPILNSPYEEPQQHWELNKDGTPTGKIENGRRRSDFLIPVPKAVQRQRQRAAKAGELALGGDERQENAAVNYFRHKLDEWRKKPLSQRKVSGITERLLRHWYSDELNPRVFFCQLEAVETFIYLNEVVPQLTDKTIKAQLDDIKKANQEANKGLERLAAKMATGAGKTTVMAMLIAYHAINHARSPTSKRYGNQFLIITPGITIKDRLRVLLPQDPNNYYEKNNLVPRDMMAEIKKANVVITNYHVFKKRDKLNLSKKQREILQGNDTAKIISTESDGQMLQRVCPELLRNGQRIIVINDEAHHCYIHKQEDNQEAIEAEEKEEATRNSEAARLWINGI